MNSEPLSTGGAPRRVSKPRLSLRPRSGPSSGTWPPPAIRRAIASCSCCPSKPACAPKKWRRWATAHRTMLCSWYRTTVSLPPPQGALLPCAGARRTPLRLSERYAQSDHPGECRNAEPRQVPALPWRRVCVPFPALAASSCPRVLHWHRICILMTVEERDVPAPHRRTAGERRWRLRGGARPACPVWGLWSSCQAVTRSRYALLA